MNRLRRLLSNPNPSSFVLLQGGLILLLQIMVDTVLVGQGMIGSLASGALWICTFLATRIQPSAQSALVAMTTVGQGAVLTASLAGHAWQMDSHMVYFAVLAGLSIYNRVDTLLLGTALIAVHHVSLTLLLPSLVYADGTFAQNIYRTSLHAAIVITEAMVLISAVINRNDLISAAEEKTATAMDERARAERAEQERQSTSDKAAQAIAVIRKRLGQMAERRLDGQIDTPLASDFEDLRNDFNTALMHLQTAIATAQNGMSNVDTETVELGRMTVNVEALLQAQSTSLVTALQSMLDLTTSIECTAALAQEASSKSEQMRRIADEGGNVTKRAVEAMERIEGTSSQVSGIVELIDDVAFQTNLLALNAGVESARAGEAGRGFAVVAGEVQALALRTAEAANGIKSLIAENARQIQEGVDLVNKAGQTLSDITSQTTNVANIIGTVNGDMKERTEDLTSLGQDLRTASNRSSDITQLGQDLTALGQRLASTASLLHTELSGFQISDHTDQTLPEPKMLLQEQQNAPAKLNSR